ncbi:MAG: hypothetical protein KA151_08530 [Piscinibacter sp.]|nr:hypothetical protein [Piscinibacter sp.]
MNLPSCRPRSFACAAVALVLSACGGGGEIGGTLSGLGTGLSVTLANNGDDELTLTRNGSFTFGENVAADSSYTVTVVTQPAGQECVVANGSGTVNSQGDSVDSVTVTCTNTPSLTGTLSGLVTGTAVTLINGSTKLALTENGPFAFPGEVSDGTAYEVTVLTQPLGAICVVANGSGTFDADVATAIVVGCL